MADLLKHLPEHRVVVCLPCQFAVQPQALSSHLLRHKIYRDRRRRLLAWLSKLHLAEPEYVSRPSPKSPPIPELPSYDGLVCLAEGCTYAGTSEKRMRQHWSSEHNEHDSRNVRSRQASLQTFFRGNKTAYFEVNGRGQSEDGRVHSISNGVRSWPFFKSPDENSDRNGQSLHLPNVDMEPLRYFHHYMISPHLKGRRDDSESDTFWKETIPREALTHDFLMNAILSFAATHLAVSASSEDECRMHYKQAMQYQVKSITGFHNAIERPDLSNSTALVATARFIGPQHLVHHQIEQRHSNGGADHVEDSSHIIETLLMLRGVAKLFVEMQPLLPLDSELILDEDSLCAMSSPSDKIERIHPISIPSQTALLYCVDTLKKQIEQIQELSEGEDTALSTAIAALRHSICLSYASESTTALWNGIESWPYLVSDDFVLMVKQAYPAALVIFAHFCPLLRRGEEHYWFLKGQAEKLIGIVRANVGADVVVLLSGLDEVMRSLAK